MFGHLELVMYITVYITREKETPSSCIMNAITIIFTFPCQPSGKFTTKGQLKRGLLQSDGMCVRVCE